MVTTHRYLMVLSAIVFFTMKASYETLRTVEENLQHISNPSVNWSVLDPI